MYENDDFVEHKFELNNKTRKADHAIIVEGNSMYPTIEDGEYIFIKEQSAIQHNEIGVFVYGDNVYCKRLNIDHKKKCLTLVSDNKEYENIVIKDISNLRTIGKVIF